MIYLLLCVVLTSDQTAAILRAAATMRTTPQWTTDLDAAMEVSEATGRPLLVYHHFPACRSCVNLATYQQQADLSGWVLVKVDISQTNPLAVRAAPTHVIMNGRTEVSRWEGQGDIRSVEKYQRILSGWSRQARGIRQ